MKEEFVFYCPEKNTIIISSLKCKKFKVTSIDKVFSKNKKTHKILIDILTGKYSKTYEYEKIGKL